MAKMIIMYEQPIDKVGFEKHYFDVHVPLGKKIPNITHNSVHHVIQSQNTNLDLYLITVLDFENMEKLTEAFASPEAKAAEVDGVNLFKYVNPPIITLVEQFLTYNPQINRLKKKEINKGLMRRKGKAHGLNPFGP